MSYAKQAFAVIVVIAALSFLSRKNASVRDIVNGPNFF